MAFIHPVARCTSGELLPARRKYREVQNHGERFLPPHPGKLACFSLICECLAVIVLYLTVPLGTTRARNRICHQINLCEPDQRESLWFLGGGISESCRHDTFVAHRFVNECNFFVDNTTRRVALRLRIPFLRSIRVSRCFYSYHFSSSRGWTKICEGFSGADARLAACAANTWLPILF